MLARKFLLQRVDLGLNQAVSSICFFDDLVIVLLRSAGDRDVGSSDAGQRVESRAQRMQRCADVVWIAHRCVLPLIVTLATCYVLDLNRNVGHLLRFCQPA